jgi:hypothetical protein
LPDAGPLNTSLVWSDQHHDTGEGSSTGPLNKRKRVRIRDVWLPASLSFLEVKTLLNTGGMRRNAKNGKKGKTKDPAQPYFLCPGGSICPESLTR